MASLLPLPVVARVRMYSQKFRTIDTEEPHIFKAALSRSWGRRRGPGISHNTILTMQTWWVYYHYTPYVYPELLDEGYDYNIEFLKSLEKVRINYSEIREILMAEYDAIQVISHLNSEVSNEIMIALNNTCNLLQTQS